MCGGLHAHAQATRELCPDRIFDTLTPCCSSKLSLLSTDSGVRWPLNPGFTSSSGLHLPMIPNFQFLLPGFRDDSSGRDALCRSSELCAVSSLPRTGAWVSGVSRLPDPGGQSSHRLGQYQGAQGEAQGSSTCWPSLIVSICGCCPR